MNYERIKELQDFANDFNAKLRDANLEYDEKIKNKTAQLSNDLSKQNTNSNSNLYNTSEQKKKQKPPSQTIFKSLKPWNPPNGYGDYFGPFLALRHPYEMSDWEIVR